MTAEVDLNNRHMTGEKMNKESRLEKPMPPTKEKNLRIQKIFSKDKELIHPSNEYLLGQLKQMLNQITSTFPNTGLTLENFKQVYPENSMCGGSMWCPKTADKGADLPYNVLVELFMASKPNSPEYFVTRIGDTKYIVYTAWIQDKYELKKKKTSHQLISFCIIFTTKDKNKDLEKLKHALLQFGQTLKFMQHTLGLLKDEFLNFHERNETFRKCNFSKVSNEQFYRRQD